jgi:hypothetical protein
MELVVTPLCTVTVHSFPVKRDAVDEVNVSAAEAVPEADADTAKAVFPHPTVLGDVRAPNLNHGKTVVNVLVECSGAFNLNENEIGVAANKIGFEITSLL